MTRLSELYNKSDDPYAVGIDTETMDKTIALLQNSAIFGTDRSMHKAKNYWSKMVFEPIVYKLHPALSNAGYAVQGRLAVLLGNKDLPNDELLDMYKRQFDPSNTDSSDWDIIMSHMGEADVETRPVMVPLTRSGGTALRLCGIEYPEKLREISLAQEALSGVAEVNMANMRELMMLALQMSETMGGVAANIDPENTPGRNSGTIITLSLPKV